jgi:hypothetical protein
MNDFLGRLIERERGAAGAVAPRLPSFYEPRSDALAAETAEGESEDTGETLRGEIPRGALQRHAEPQSAEPATAQRAAQAVDTVSAEPIVKLVARSAPQAASDTISPARSHIDAPPMQERAIPDVDSRKPEQATPHASIAAPLSPEIASRAVPPPNEPEQPVAQTRVPPVMARRLAPLAAEPRDASVAALVPEPSPRRTVAQSTAPREPDTAEPMQSVRPLPVMPVIAIPHQAGDSVLAVPQRTPAATPPNPGEIAPAPVPHTGDAAPSRDQDAPAPMPTIHVTIGRVEVRAVQAPARDARPVRASEQPMSLDEYLRRRNHRGRA